MLLASLLRVLLWFKHPVFLVSATFHPPAWFPERPSHSSRSPRHSGGPFPLTASYRHAAGRGGRRQPWHHDYRNPIRLLQANIESDRPPAYARGGRVCRMQGIWAVLVQVAMDRPLAALTKGGAKTV
jgi:hypothetical protein